jgi:zinc transport system substrate-binding protein
MKKNLILLLMVLLATACGSKQGEGERVLTVTIEPLRYFTEQLAGEQFRVVSMVPGGQSPETYDPTPQQLVQLSHSEAYFAIGYLGFEQTWMNRLRENAPQMQVFNLSEGIALIREEASAAHTDEPGAEGAAVHHHAQGVDPHLWNSPANAKVLVRNICRALCQLDSAHQSLYEARQNTLLQKIEATDQQIRTLLEQPHDHTFLIYHPALTYFARDYGLAQHCIEEAGKEPSANHLKALVDRCQADSIRVVFVQQEFDTRNAMTIAQETHTQVVPINPLNYQWEEELIRTAQALCHE